MSSFAAARVNAFGGGIGGKLSGDQQFIKIVSTGRGKSIHVIHGGVPLAAFQLPDISEMQPTLLRQLLLRPAQREPQVSQIAGKDQPGRQIFLAHPEMLKI